MILATSSKEGEPWASPLFFAYDKDFYVYWSSAKSAHHSKLLEENPHVALVIYSNEVTNRFWEALYVVGKAHEVTEDEFADAFDIYYQRGHPLLVEDEQHILFAKDFSGDAPRRLYKCHPTKVYLINPPLGTTEDHIESRAQVDLNLLKNLDFE